MPSEQPMDAQDLSTLQRSWQTRMTSVLRQFNNLTSGPVFDKKHDHMVNIIGLTCVFGEPGIQVIPTDGGPVYTAKVEDLES